MDVYRRSADERIRLTWMGGAGFLITFGGLRIGIDIYLSDACHGADGSFKRLTPAPCRAQELDVYKRQTLCRMLYADVRFHSAKHRR